MLSREHAIASFDWERKRVFADRLTRKTHAHYEQLAERMLAVYRDGVGRPRRELHRAVEAILSLEPDCPTRRIQAFCKLLDDASVFQRDGRAKSANLRRRLFRLAAQYHPLVQRSDGLFENEVLRTRDRLATELGTTWSQIDAELYADVIEFQPLVKFEGYRDGSALLARYNVAQAQAVLYDATQLIVRAQADFKRILRAAKLSGLMHSIQRRSDGAYDIRLDGPASVLRRTRRYGAGMARFLATLLACRDWRLQAQLATRRRLAMRFVLSSEDGLRSHLDETPEFDSQLERNFAERWGVEPRDGWTLHREPTVVCRGQRVFVPDFEFRRPDGSSVLMEIVGFWTPEYLESKLRTLAEVVDGPILLAVPSDSASKWRPPDGHPVLVYKSELQVDQVLKVLERWRDGDTLG